MMNERIKQLVPPKLKEWGGDSGDNFSEELDKFAELIIRDCAKTARLTPCPYTDTDMLQRLGHTWDMCAFDAGSEILNRFEIK